VETAKGKTREETINKLADRIDVYEKYGSPHSRLMAELAMRLARRLSLASQDTSAIAEAALLHDIGLYAMGPSYHSSPNPLSFEERMDLWRHPVVGEQQMAKREATRHAQLLVRWHHEWWNGTGYPDTLAFEDIPIGARVLRAVELYCALISDRPYRAALSEPEALESLKKSAGIECDPAVVQALVGLLESLLKEPARPEMRPAEAVRFDPTGQRAAYDPEPQPHMAETGEQSLPEAIPDQLSEWPRAATRAGIESKETGISTEPSDSSRLPRFSPRDHEIEPVVSKRPLSEKLMARMREGSIEDTRQPRAWATSRYNRKSLLGFEASVLRQIEFRSIAIPFSSLSRLDWYLKAWGRQILANDPRGWMAEVLRATSEARLPLGEEQIARLLQDLYIPGTRLSNPDLRRWFSETDAWWMDNLRRNIESILEPDAKAQALLLGMQTGDYAVSFNDATIDLRQPLAVIFWRLAGRFWSGPAGHPQSRSFNLPAEEFTRQSRADLLYLSIPPAHAESGGAEARSEWRKTWVSGPSAEGANEPLRLITAPQSKQSYLVMIDRLLRSAQHIKTWAIEYQEIGLASAADISEVIKEHRPLRATYSKDLTEVVGGLRNYIIIADSAAPKR
jgi:hypothetical protein